MKNSMGKREIAFVFKQRTALQTQFFIFKKRLNTLNRLRVAFAFSRKVGNAVQRNRYKRRVREILWNTAGKDAGADVLCVAKQSLARLDKSLWTREKKRITEWCETF